MLKYILILSFGLTLLSACQQGNNNDLALSETSAEAMVASETADANAELVDQMESRKEAKSPEKPIVAINKKIVRSGQLTLTSKNSKAAKARIDQSLKKLEGYYEEEKISAGDSYTNYSLIIRVPVQSFDAFILALEQGDDQLISKTLHAEDVSLQYFDLESRLKSKRTYLVRYQELVSRANSVRELLEIEEQIRQLQEDIDSQESVLRTLSGQLAFGTLRLQITDYDYTTAFGGNSFGTRIKDAFVFGWNLFQQLLLGLIDIWPIVLLTVGSVMLWRRLSRRKKSL